jgi:flavin-dependent dehydrogenase
MSTLPPFRRHYDAVVVGARPAGAATAMLLARSGLDVLAIDRGGYGTDALSTHALMRAGVVQLQRWGLLDAIRAARTPVVRTTTFHYGPLRTDVAIKPNYGIDGLYAPRRTVLDAVLVDAARQSGADVRHHTKLIDLERSSSGVVTGVVLTDAHGAHHVVGAPLVIGADGTHSPVAALVDAQAYRRSRHATATMYGYWSGLANAGYEYYFGHRVSAGVFPTNDDMACVFVAVPPERFLASGGPAGAEDLFGAALAEAAPELAPRLAAGERVGGLRSFAGIRGYVRQSYGPGWALVGDAGYFKDPSTAHGITDALRDAELLARAVLQGSATALADYQNRRDALSTEVLDITDRIASFDWQLDELPALHRDLSDAMRAEVTFLSHLDQPPAPLRRPSRAA